MLGEAQELKLILTAGVGSDHIDLGEAAERDITVAEITGSNTVSVAEHAVMQVQALVRNFVPAYKDVVDGGWSIGEIAAGSHDLEKKTVGVYGAGQIGQLIAARLKPFVVETEALVEALEEGHLGGYAGDVWDPQPAPSDHPWRTMPNHAMTPHVSGTTLEAQKRYAAGVRDSLENFIQGRPIRDDYVMVADGEIQSGSYKAIYG